MDYPYTILDIVNNLSKSKQSIYNLFDKNKELIRNNSIRKGRKIYYNQAVMDFLNDYYENGTPINAPNTRIDASALAHEENTHQEELDALRAKISTLEAQIEAKDKQIADLISQNNLTLLLLSQEKQEKALLLPAPRQTLVEKLKSIFKK